MSQNAPNCGVAPIFSQIISWGVTPRVPDQQNWGGSKLPPGSPFDDAHRSTFSELPRPLMSFFHMNSPHGTVLQNSIPYSDANYVIAVHHHTVSDTLKGTRLRTAKSSRWKLLKLVAFGGENILGWQKFACWRKICRQTKQREMGPKIWASCWFSNL